VFITSFAELLGNLYQIESANHEMQQGQEGEWAQFTPGAASS